MKRLLLSLIVIVAFTVPVHATISIVDKTISGSADGSGFTTTAINSTTATFCYAAIANFTGTGHDDSLSDSNMNTWTALTPQTDASNHKIAAYYAVNPSVGMGHTATLTDTGGGSAFSSVWFGCFSGVITASPLDTQTGTTGTNVATQPSGSITTSASTNIAITAIAFGASVSSVTVNSSFLSPPDFVNTDGAHNVGLAVSYKVSVSGTENPSFSWTSLVDDAITIADFKATGGGGGGGGSTPHNGTTLGVGH